MPSFYLKKTMLTKIIPVLIFAAAAICIIQLINRSFSYTYKSIETSVEKPYAKAQQIYEAEANNY